MQIGDTQLIYVKKIQEKEKRQMLEQGLQKLCNLLHYSYIRILKVYTYL
jgi:hypothetical protein